MKRHPNEFWKTFFNHSVKTTETSHCIQIHSKQSICQPILSPQIKICNSLMAFFSDEESANIKGEDLQNVPLWPLLQKERNVDFIFAVDSSADTQNWPNGTSFVATYQRFMINATGDVVFPYVPDQQTYPQSLSKLTLAL